MHAPAWRAAKPDFVEVDLMRNDIYEARFANGSERFVVGLGADGKIVFCFFQPSQGSHPQGPGNALRHEEFGKKPWKTLVNTENLPVLRALTGRVFNL